MITTSLVYLSSTLYGNIRTLLNRCLGKNCPLITKTSTSFGPYSVRTSRILLKLYLCPSFNRIYKSIPPMGIQDTKDTKASFKTYHPFLAFPLLSFFNLIYPFSIQKLKRGQNLHHFIGSASGIFFSLRHSSK